MTNTIYYILTSISTYTICELILKTLKKKLKPPNKIKSQKDKKLQKKQYLQYIENYISLIHALIMIFFTLKTILKKWDPKRQNSFSDNILFSFSLTYYIWDTIFCIKNNLFTSLMFNHHLLMIFMNFYVMNLKDYNFLFMNMYFLGEITNPFYLLYVNLGYHCEWKKISEFFGVFFSVSFIFVRVFYCGSLTFHAFRLVDAPLVLKAFLAFGYYISLKLSFFIFNKFLKGLKDIIEINILIIFYSKLLILRNLKYFNLGFELFSIFISFGPLLVFQHNRYIF